MKRLLFLSHRIPYPPEKGEKIRAWHILDHLARSWAVEAGFLVDDRADLQHLPVLARRCAHVEWRPALSRFGTAARALSRLRPGLPLTLGWFHHPGLFAWAQAGLAAGRYDAVLVFSSAMAPYAMGPAARRPGLRRVLDMVDIDSEKWAAYAQGAAPPMRQVWAREARTLLGFERRAAREFDRTLLVSAAEAARFAALAPEVAPRLAALDNGVDLARFDSARDWPNPFPRPAPALVFTGSMGYRPNVDAVTWFAEAILPRLRGRPGPMPEFWIVGANPAPAVQALAKLPGVTVTGTVPDVRPYLAHAACAVAPLRIARGIQNKVLEAMAMARPVVATPEAHEGLRATAGRDLLVAVGEDAFAAAIAAVLAGAHPGLGAAGRAAVMAGHDWAGCLAPLDALMHPPEAAAAPIAA
ncbi:TIGR03087 family PEP-CTERM/XrtA system glycosyltransferase [Siccirubricoccus sp. KC 17139]|uniref:TIGR03087 family PEP-CTERM/XrtA system glycosyltransferase n=1 Tax=Siccirubricoccus soli TaxID=2899147 RepID=A0ABT1DCX6_9PROT|nr:TIGR03087 family PEP-CTERM/XrtA system glycosyltransferase [Siccirubricoccus soli]MCO6419786.1 TIGR03087 family PEP-CTERM/XrtA system glycosyltransferase [Siccirubricoccus soli]MCP2685921.1 TIGR03087 family PEP-CTERM/XrtA system glycosyltransferase [Siccirubricoccus soli]